LCFSVCFLASLFVCLSVGQIDMACALLETCGRFLHRLPETNMRMENTVREFV